jgi:hypothetical protein
VRAGVIFKFKITPASIFCLDLSQNEHIFSSKEPRPQGGALKPKFSKPKNEIPKSLDPELDSGPGSG